MSFLEARMYLLRMTPDVLTRQLDKAVALVGSLLVLVGCSSLPYATRPVPSYALTATDINDTKLGKLLQPHAAQHPGQSGFALILNGEDAFRTRINLANEAQRTLDLQYYSVGDDLSTALLLSRIVHAANRGVRVRVLLDDVHASARQFAKRAITANSTIQIRLFNPFRSAASAEILRWSEFLYDGDRLNRRMHNKLWLTDNAVAVTGSRNLADEYFNASSTFNFYDVDLLAAGPIVSELSSEFDTYWNNLLSVPYEALEVPPTADEISFLRKDLEDMSSSCSGKELCQWADSSSQNGPSRYELSLLTWAKSQLSYDTPGSSKSEAGSGIQHGSREDMPGGAHTVAELLIASPYFIPGERGQEHLSAMRERGVRVAVLTNSLASTDSPAAHAGYARHRVGLLRKGIELYEIRPESRRRHHFKHRWGDGSATSLHAKIIVQDRTRAIIGSLNQDPRSRLYNTEAWILIESPKLAGELAALFDESTDPGHAYRLVVNKRNSLDTITWTAEEDGGVLSFDDEPLTSPLLRLWRGVLGVLIPEKLL